MSVRYFFCKAPLDRLGRFTGKGTAQLFSARFRSHHTTLHFSLPGFIAMRPKRNPIYRYTHAMILSAAVVCPSVAVSQELNAPQSGQSVRIAANDNGIRSETVTIDDLDVYAITLPTENQAHQVDTEPVVTAELLQQRSADGKLQVERWVTEDAVGNLVNHGVYKEYDTKGAIVRTGTFRMGKLDGVWKQTIALSNAQAIADTIDSGFRPPFQSEANFVNGNLEGDWTLSDSTGNAVLVWQFENNLRSGASVWLNSRGKAVREVTYRDGVPDGPSTRFQSTQKEPEKFIYYQGKVLKSRTVWHDPDRRTKKKYEESLLVPGGEQIVSHDWWNSQVSTEPVPTAEPLRHGTLVGWHANGAKSVEGQFLHNQPTGHFQWWYPSGQLQSKGAYVDGLMTGTWDWWYPNGMKMLHGDYELGEQTGLWSQWSADGKLVQRDDAEDFPTVKQDILPPTESILDAKEKPANGVATQPQMRRPTTQYRVRR